LELITEKKIFCEDIQNNKNNGFLNFHIDSLFLHEQIDLLSFLHTDAHEKKGKIKKIIDIDWLSSTERYTGNIINYRIPQSARNIGYGFGISRLLAYTTNEDHFLV